MIKLLKSANDDRWITLSGPGEHPKTFGTIHGALQEIADFFGSQLIGVGHSLQIPAAWVEIDRAPKDGSPVLGWRQGWDLPRWVAWRLNSRTGTEFWDDWLEQDDYELETAPPTHWLVIPPPPTVTILEND